MHEALVGVLNRRFINCYYNAFAGAGADPTATTELARLGVDPGELKYGAIFTSSGERIVSFGYSRDEFYRSIARALEENPSLNEPSLAEREVFARAEGAPSDVAAQIAAAQVRVELLEFDAGAALCDRLLVRDDIDAAARARVLAMKAHVALLDLRSDRREEARAILASIESAPADIADDIAVDLVSCDVGLAPTAAFYGGWRMEPEAAEAHEESIREWLQRDPESNRRGEMMFYLGLALVAQDDLAGANVFWRRHVDELPDDRYAMLSRLHNSEYIFSPFGSNKVTRMGGSSMIVDSRADSSTPAETQKGDGELMSLLKRLASSGGRLEIRGNEVYIGDELLSEEEAALILGAIRGQAGVRRID